VRIKLVAPVQDPKALLLQLKSDEEVIPKGATAYKETLLMVMAGAYGAPDLYGVRVWNEDDEHAVLVHYGQDLRNQKEDITDHGKKSELVYRLQSVGYQPIGDFDVSEWKFRWTEFFGDVITISDLGTFIRVYREFPGNDTNVFAEKQKQAYMFLHRFGIGIKDLLPYDVRGFLVMMILQAAQQGQDGQNPQQ